MSNQRTLRQFFFVILLCPLALVGCNSADQDVISRGIGTDLYTTGLPDQSAQLDAYIAEICEQAGISAGPGAGCSISSSVSPDWTLFVRAGMNDIDRRCDAYLQWLDDRRRTNNAIIHEIGDTQTGAETIMTAARAAAPAIAIAAAAFGFARNTFTNINSRLLFEVDHSTVEAVVLSRQKAFRDGLTNIIDNRPAAIYAVRGYLRLCLPYTIETEINNTITVLARGDTNELNKLVTPPSARASVIGPGAGAAHVSLANVNEPVPHRTFTATVALNAVGIAEKIPSKELQQIQTALCIEPTGDFGSPQSHTRQAINEYLSGIKGRRVDASRGLTTAQVNQLERAPAVGGCREGGFLNPFEVGAFGASSNGSEAISGLQEGMAAALNVVVPVGENGRLGPQTRNLVAQYREKVGRLFGANRDDPANRQVDFDLYTFLAKQL